MRVNEVSGKRKLFTFSSSKRRFFVTFCHSFVVWHIQKSFSTPRGSHIRKLEATLNKIEELPLEILFFFWFSHILLIYDLC